MAHMGFVRSRYEQIRCNMAEGETDVLSPEEQAYFESGGEKDVETTDEQVNTEQSEETKETAPEETATEEEKEQQRDEKGRFVPHQALHAEREEHKKTRAELQELKEFRARMEERWKLIEQSQQKTQETEEDTPPDPNEDIFAFSRWQAEQLKKLNAKISEREQREQQYLQQS